jgi:branched-subunit amino acid aminotransferase/4-amino-4-deoxychorismate lyase
VTSTIRLPAGAPALVHGIGLFETMRVVRGRVLHQEAHFDRMLASAQALGFENPASSRFHAETARALAAFGACAGEASMRCSWIQCDPDDWRMLATASEIPDVTLRRRRRGRVITLGRELVRSMPVHKLTSYAACVIGLQNAVAAGADEGLFVDSRRRILEGTSTNVFAIDGETLLTPPIRAGILPGVTRALVIDEAHARGWRVVERTLTKDDLLRGSFLTGSLTGIAAIRVLDGAPCRAPSAVRLRKLRRRADVPPEHPAHRAPRTN